MVDAPCSRIGHIYRKFAPFPNPGVGDFVGRVGSQCCTGFRLSLAVTSFCHLFLYQSKEEVLIVTICQRIKRGTLISCSGQFKTLHSYYMIEMKNITYRI